MTLHKKQRYLIVLRSEDWSDVPNPFATSGGFFFSYKLLNRIFSCTILGTMTKHSSGATVVTRFAPSPTGLLHVGGFRTALFNYLYAKHNGGKVILRIEDTDKERSKPEYEKNILEGLEWLDLKCDETYKQSERTEVYTSYLSKIVKEGKAYVSKETPKDGGRDEVIRFKNPNTVIVFNDLIRGETKFDTTDLGDFVIAKSLTEPLYHFAVVVDDHEMGITHVIRGEEHISNTPRQILIGRAIGAREPIYAHVPLILAPDRSKLSKRRGARALTSYRDEGYLPEALINYMAMLGWNPGTEEELFTLEELVKIFDIAKVQKSGAIYNEEKLRWLNKEHLKRKTLHSIEPAVEEVVKKSEVFKEKHWKMPKGLIQKISPIVLDRISTFGDIETMLSGGELNYFFEEPEYEKSDLLWKDEESKNDTIAHLTEATRLLEESSDKGLANAESVKELLWNYATEKGKGSVLWPIRFALTGREKSPDPFTVIAILGKETSISRLKKATALLA